MNRLRTALKEREGGFTLIELLVVIIIIGILAAIAIPVFLNQRNKGYDSQAKSDLRNGATIEETYLNDHGTYGTLVQIQGTGYDYKMSADTTVTVPTNTQTHYCLEALSKSGNTFHYDNTAGSGVLDGACP